MVLGLGSRNKKVHIDYELRLFEVKPWRQPGKWVSIHWQQGDKQSGKSKRVVPQAEEGDGGTIVFNEAFKLPVTFQHEKGATTFQAKLVVFTLLEASSSSSNNSSNSGKGKALASATLDLVAYASLIDHVSINLPMTISGSNSTTDAASGGAVPNLFLSLRPYHSGSKGKVSKGDYDRSKSMPATGMGRAPSVSPTSLNRTRPLPAIIDEQDCQAEVSSLLSDDDEEEIASFTDGDDDDDDNEFPSFLTHSPAMIPSASASASDLSLSPPRTPSHVEVSNTSKGEKNERADLVQSRPVPAKAAAAAAAAAYALKRNHTGRSSRGSSIDFSSEPESFETDGYFTPHPRSPAWMVKSPARHTRGNSLPGSPWHDYGMGSLMNNHSFVYSPEQSRDSREGGFIMSPAIPIKSPSHHHPLRLGPKDDVSTNNKPVEEVLLEERGKMADVKSPSIEAGGGEEPSERQEALHAKSDGILSSEEEEAETKNIVVVTEMPSYIENTQERGFNKMVQLDTNNSDKTNNDNASPKSRAIIDIEVEKKVEVLDDRKVNGEIVMIEEEARIESLKGGETMNESVEKEALEEAKQRAMTAESKVVVMTEIPSNIENTQETGINKMGQLDTNNYGKTNNDKASPKARAIVGIEVEKKVEASDDRKVNGEIVMLEEEAQNESLKSGEIMNKSVEKEALEETKQRAVIAESKVVEIEAKYRLLESQIEKIRGELIDAAAIEAALYSMVAEHGSSSHKAHTAARRLARLYMYSCKNWSKERRARSARNSVSGLVLVARACGNDVPRLTYWWSNVVVLRETIHLMFDRSESFTSKPSWSPGAAGGLSSNWIEASTFIAALERVESWIHAKVVESIWWQVLTPWMQNFEDQNLQHTNNEGKESNASRDDTDILDSDIGDGRKVDTFLDFWKKAFSNAFERLCPVRGAGIDCGCVPMLARLVIDSCVARLDVAMLNALLRGSEDDIPTDPISDPICNLNVLPIAPGSLSFGSGAQMKNTMGRLAAWITDLVTSDHAYCHSQSLVEEETSFLTFPLLKAAGDLLMLPKDMLMDNAMRKEVCPALNLPLIRRILQNYVPDEFSPDLISPSLFDTLSTEISLEAKNNGETDWILSSHGSVPIPKVVYIPPSSNLVREWIGDPIGSTRFGRSNSSLMRKGHTSDDELDEVESPISWLIHNCYGMSKDSSNLTDLTDLIPNYREEGGHTNGTQVASFPKGLQEEAGRNHRFQFLRKVWTGNTMGLR